MHMKHPHITVLFFASVLFILPVPSLIAQGEGGSEPTTTTTTTTVPGTEEELSLWQLILQGGITMFPLGLFSIAVVTLVIRNAIILREEKLLRPDLVPLIHERLADGDIGGTHLLCRQQPSLLTNVLEAGLERVRGQEVEIAHVKEAIEEAGTEQLLSHMKPIGYLSIIGAIAPMLGLLGTVSGMIKAFQHIAQGGMGKPEVLAGDIGEALVTTATGLIIAIPAMLFYFYFKNNFMKTMASMGRITGAMMDTLESGAPTQTDGEPRDQNEI